MTARPDTGTGRDTRAHVAAGRHHTTTTTNRGDLMTSTTHEPPEAGRDVLAIVGSVTFTNPDALALAEDLILGVFSRRRPDAVVSGGADGIDTLGVTLAEKAGIETIVHPPKVRQWAAPGGFRDRNLLIARDCTRLLRIVCRASRTYGSGWTADQAEKQGKTVWRVTL